MLITLKTLQQQTFKIEIDPECKVSELKEKIAAEKGSEYAVANQKLIYAGKILEDGLKLDHYKIDEKNFVVIMITASKGGKTEPAAAPVSKETAAPTTTSTATTAPAPATTSTTTTTPVISSPSAEESIHQAENTLVMGENFEDTVKEIIDMGFAREQVEHAMRVSFNNPDRAVEYLLSTMTETDIDVSAFNSGQGSLGVEEMRDVAQATTQATTPNPASSDEPLAFLRSQPQFQQMKVLIQANPELLPTILDQIRTSNPRLLQIITENQDRFVQMLNEPSDSTTPASASSTGPPPESGYIQVTPEEKRAVERLKQLGFSEGMCIQAYFACEKNEELAANLLLSEGMEDDGNR